MPASFSPPSGPTQWLFQEPPVKSSLLAASPMRQIRNHPWGIRRIAAICLLLTVCNGSTVRAADQSIVVNGSAADMNESVFEEIAKIAKDKPSEKVDLGIGAIFSYLNQPGETTLAQIKTFLSLSERFNIPIVVQLDVEQWWQELPQEKKHLLIGIKLGWESSIGVNSFHYPNGNALLNQSESEDPRTGIKSDQIPSRGVATIGYAAVATAGLANGGELQEARNEDPNHNRNRWRGRSRDRSAANSLYFHLEETSQPLISPPSGPTQWLFQGRLQPFHDPI